MNAPRSVSVIGLGRVGLPLALCFADRGLRVLGVDHDQTVLDAIRAGRMPFSEAGTQEMLDRVVASGRLDLAERAVDAARADDIVITIGTPSFSHIESDLRQVRAAVDDLLPMLRPGHALILRSTIAPGTTEFVAGYLEKRRRLRVGEDLFVAHAPERIAAGRFVEEISTLPCIVGGVGEASTERAASTFSVFGAPIVRTTPVQAELAKIWTNILRYTTFALPNLLMMDCERYGANVFEVIDLINRDYPRGGIARPGMTAGTCLRKDFAFSEERSAAPGMLLAVSRVNESVPLFLVEGIKRRIGSLSNRKVAVLGLTFKRDTDDERDSLSPKLIRLLERELADVAVCDPHAPSPTQPLDQAVADADVVIVATNHSAFEGRRGARRDRGSSLRGLPAGRSVGRARHRAGVRLRRRDLGAAPRRRLGLGARGQRGRMSRVLVTGGAGTIGSAVVRRLLADSQWEVRVADYRRPPLWMREGCEIHTTDLRELEPRSRGGRRLLARDPPGRDRRRDRQLPQAPVHAHRGQQRAHRRRSSTPRSISTSSASCTSPPRWCSSARPSSPRPRSTCRLPDPALRLRVLEARRRGLHPRRARPARAALHDLPAVQRVRPGRAARRPTSPGSPTPCPT